MKEWTYQLTFCHRAHLPFEKPQQYLLNVSRHRFNSSRIGSTDRKAHSAGLALRIVDDSWVDVEWPIVADSRS
ncbi:hypothetical protein CIW54_27650 [Paraburkholderia sp. T12-10]|nr:hypothetical protein CIW54_27650 [Paraburkholderia sp. T12-10]